MRKAIGTFLSVLALAASAQARPVDEFLPDDEFFGSLRGIRTQAVSAPAPAVAKPPKPAPAAAPNKFAFKVVYVPPKDAKFKPWE